MCKSIKNLSNKYPLFFEIIRFLITGTIATVLEMLIMGVIIYIVNPAVYEYHFINVFLFEKLARTWLVVIASAIGFIFGLIINYVLSVFYVYKGENKFSKTIKGVLLFSLLSIAGLVIQSLGMFLLYGVLNFNEWISKVILVILVIIFNYITRKTLVFNNKKA